MGVKYSFLVPVYNVENYLTKCVESLVNQNFDSECYEVILVDDGSTDSSASMCDHFAAKYSNVITIHQENKGLLLARGTAVKKSRGEYLIFVDSDDFVDTGLLTIVDRNLSQHEYDMIMFGFYRECDGRAISEKVTDADSEPVFKRRLLELFAGTDNYNHIWARVIKGSLLREHYEEIYKMRLNIGEDKIQTAILIKYSENVLFIKECLYHYVYRSESIAHKKAKDEIISAIAVYSSVESIVSETADLISMTTEEKNRLMSKYEVTAVEGILEHLFKYNKRKDIIKADKINELKEVLDSNIQFFSIGTKMVKKLKIYNRIRYRLLIKENFGRLIELDGILDCVQKICRMW